ncbi:general secretion pathway protein GspB [Massilia yuzhufengensis]|uniref:General secretion pathway protein B n=1 Tax=Massilia yuzhufengensis TaxID=1164594 RepID=A0A1I1SMS6_9BURK|nr:general secretion pathway protein GspB [Massilia yuzhufengensis]SFD47785.1 general secretion pathway protein B [Massilia yuzhufengensis]
MSYILEALKKAQAERQLGSAPTIHAPAPSYAAPAAGANRKALIVGLGAGALVVALGALFLLRQPAPAPALQVASVAAPVPAPVPVAVPAAPPPTPVTAAPPEPAAPAKPKEAAARPAVPAPMAEPAPRIEPAEAAPEAPRPAPVLDDNVGALQSLPEAIQRDVPKVTVGGYIYSPNPSERLLLVDKTLRREGEEVAPGLVLERLLPKAAIMNFRGYRYRVGY